MKRTLIALILISFAATVSAGGFSSFCNRCVKPVVVQKKVIVQQEVPVYQAIQRSIYYIPNDYAYTTPNTSLSPQEAAYKASAKAMLDVLEERGLLPKEALLAPSRGEAVLNNCIRCHGPNGSKRDAFTIPEGEPDLWTLTRVREGIESHGMAGPDYANLNGDQVDLLFKWLTERQKQLLRQGAEPQTPTPAEPKSTLPLPPPPPLD